MLCRARWARPDCLSSRHSLSFSQAGDFASAEARSGLSLGAAYTLLCADGKSPEATKRLLAKFMTMEAKYPEECDRARADSWAKLVDFFQTW